NTTVRVFRKTTGTRITGRFSTQTSIPGGVRASRMNTTTQYIPVAAIRRTRPTLLIIVCLDNRGADRPGRTIGVLSLRVPFYRAERMSARSDAVMRRPEESSGISGQTHPRGSPQDIAMRPD